MNRAIRAVCDELHIAKAAYGMVAYASGKPAGGMAMFDVLAISVLAVAVVIPVTTELLWYLIETELNDNG